MSIASEVKGLRKLYDRAESAREHLDRRIDGLFIQEHTVQPLVRAVKRQHDGDGKQDQPPISGAYGCASTPPGVRSVRNLTEDAQKPNDGPKVVFVDISTGADIDQYLQHANGLRAFFIRKRNSSRPLAVTDALFNAILDGLDAAPQFRDQILFMGKRDPEYNTDTELEMAFLRLSA
ncbi:uncharacterized protein AB675_596 [Cyphellophora attinorum]|uniref:Uncharacterized protein n=1 Tax=Cyphellophora attinorum TaxID=1664694 RepID=A0A0N1HYP7_9EURO|nr:uncharacterized protein AB675_596 [Phialophora attinorum]KPI46027.1 hypothetical protein AB675_596 [Phialophora attinorum]